ncbi:MAG: hypothetical protein SO016_06470 [Lachnospiraceae bacterium]|nr:hypothetical protein [Robinsoniella sp.]MDY3766330.1 hypothetical protein [Lachnospiraceae bacterium]
MDQQLHEEALRSPQLSNQLIDTLKEWLEYSSISFINDTVFVLKIIRRRIERGDHIVLEQNGTKLTQKSFRKFLDDNFSSYISSEVFADDGEHGKEKIYFQLESCEGGYNLVIADDGNAKTYEWISSLSEKFSLVYMIATGIVYIKNVRKGTYSPFISEHGKYCRYDKELGKLLEI